MCIIKYHYLLFMIQSGSCLYSGVFCYMSSFSTWLRPYRYWKWSHGNVLPSRKRICPSQGCYLSPCQILTKSVVRFSLKRLHADKTPLNKSRLLIHCSICSNTRVHVSAQETTCQLKNRNNAMNVIDLSKWNLLLLIVCYAGTYLHNIQRSSAHWRIFLIHFCIHMKNSSAQHRK